MFPESARRTLYHINTSATFADVFIFICTPSPTCTVLLSEFVRRSISAIICRQNAVVGVHHKRNPFGIVVKPTAQRGLLLGMCGKCRVFTANYLIEAPHCFSNAACKLAIVRSIALSVRVWLLSSRMKLKAYDFLPSGSLSPS